MTIDPLLEKAQRFNTLFMERQLAAILGQRFDPVLLVELFRLKLDIDAELDHRKQKAKAEGA